MAETAVICPTHGRAGRVITLKLLPDIPLCVAESQLPLYKEHYPDAEYLVHPDDVVGIAPKRTWILENVDAENVMMIDDDTVAMVDVSTPPGDPMKITDPQRIYDVIDSTFQTAKQMGAYLVGFSSFADPALYRPQSPFKLTGMVSGNAMGIRKGGKLWFPNSARIQTDDLWVSGINAHEHRIAFQDMRYGFSVRKTFQDTGGMALNRTWDAVLENEKMMLEAFGEEAVYRRKDSARSTIKVEVQLNLRVPF